MSRDALTSLTTSVFAAGVCEMPILEPYIKSAPQASPSSQSPQAAAKTVALTALLTTFREIAETTASPRECFARLQRQLSTTALLNGVWWLAPIPDNSAVVEQPMRMLAHLEDDAACCLWQAKQEELLSLVKRAVSQGSMAQIREPRHTSLAVPIQDGRGQSSVLLFSLATSLDVGPEEACVAMALALESNLRRQSAERERHENRALSDWIQLQRLLDESASLAEASIKLVNYLKSLLRVGQVTLLLSKPRSGQLQVAAVSDLEQPDPTSQAAKALVTAATFMPENQVLHTWSPEQQDDPHALTFKQCTAWLGSEGIMIGRLRHGHDTVGYIVIGASREQTADPVLASYLTAWVPCAASHLVVVQRAHQTVLQRMKLAMIRVAIDARYQVIRYGLALFALLMIAPWPYRVSTPCQLELVHRRYIAAPFDGLLEMCFVENGDTVEVGQLLARMDGRQLRLELASKQAELAGQLKRRESQLARGDVAQSLIAQQQAAALQAEIELLHKNLHELEIRSPLAGVIISGDLEKAQGAPLKIGDTMFEIGPLDQLVVELEIPDADVRLISAGQSVKVLLDAFPMTSWQGEIERIHPRSELRRNQNVFIAEVKLDNHEHLLRPGLRGRARVFTGWSSLGWSLFHKPLERVSAFVSW